MVDRICAMSQTLDQCSGGRLRRALRPAGAFGTLAGCGQKGPLHAAEPRAATAADAAPRRRRIPAPCRRRRRAAPMSAARRARTSPTRGGAALRSKAVRSTRLARELRHAAVRLFAAPRCCDALAAYQRALAGRDAPGLLRDEGQLEPGGAADLRRRPAAASTSSPAASSSACWPPAATRRKVVFSGVGKTRAEMRRALEVGVQLLQRRERGRTELLSRGGARRRTARAGQPAREPGRRRRDAPVHLHRPEGQQVRHRPRARRWRRTGARPRCRASRWSASTATSARRSPRPAPYLDALDRLLDLVEAVEAAGIRIRHLDVGGGLGITYTDETPPDADALVARAARSASMRAAMASAKLMFEPGRSLVGNAGVLVTEVLYLKPGAREELLHRRCGDERPDAPGDVRGLDAHRAVHAARRRTPAPGTSSARSANRATGSGRDRELAVQPGDLLAVLSAGAYA